MDIIVGHTGFVGSNLLKQHEFDKSFNSKNIADSYFLNPELLVYSGIRAEKFYANSNPIADFRNIENAFNNIIKINPKKIVLISTIDVYDKPIDIYEVDYKILKPTEPYGINRLKLEQLIQENFSDFLIVRLPALYGENIKKNFIFDIINEVPSLLSEIKYMELSNNSEIIKESYLKNDSGFYAIKTEITDNEYKIIKSEFISLGFTALNFTDSRSKFQFYNLNNLWNDILLAINNNIKILNLATEPLTASEIYEYVFERKFENELLKEPFNYDFKTNYYKLFNSSEEGYIKSKREVLIDIKKFIEARIW